MKNSTTPDDTFRGAWCNRIITRQWGCYSTTPVDKQIKIYIIQLSLRLKGIFHPMNSHERVHIYSSALLSTALLELRVFVGTNNTAQLVDQLVAIQLLFEVNAEIRRTLYALNS